ncbi:MAG: lactate racemase domain-containing protein [Desulfobacterales bacterium]|nr:lactate racemase domain-containing protein [Desulfobacterales bacterium]
MNQIATIPWNAWFGDQTLELAFPHDWQVTTCAMADAPALDSSAIRAAFDNPVNTPTIKEMAKGKTSAAIVMDDISRPTRGEPILKVMLEELEKGGISRDRVKIILALGGHRPMMREDLIKKVGEEINQTVDVMNHYLHENLTDCGVSALGNPIFINRYFMDADLKLSVSSITPHVWAGFGGGAKNIVPGIAGVDTLMANHRMADEVGGELTGVCHPNRIRADIEDIARRIGLDCVVNVISNTQRDTAGIFVGDVVDSHRQATEFARKVYTTPMIWDQDVVVLNSYPKDTEILQITNSFNLLQMTRGKIVKEDGIVIITGACPEGRGYHGIMGHGARFFYDQSSVEDLFLGRKGMVFSPNLGPHDFYHYFPGSTRLFTQWDDLIRAVVKEKGSGLKAAVYPNSVIQMPGSTT